MKIVDSLLDCIHISHRIGKRMDMITGFHQAQTFVYEIDNWRGLPQPKGLPCDKKVIHDDELFRGFSDLDMIVFFNEPSNGTNLMEFGWFGRSIYKQMRSRYIAAWVGIFTAGI